MTEIDTTKAGQQGAQRDFEPDQRILHAIRRIIRAVDLDSKRLALEYGITTPQLLCLDEIIAKGAMMVRSVASEVHLSASTIVGVIDRLEAKGLARRERTSLDRRKVMVVPTEAGRELVARVPSALQGKLAQALKNLPAQERLSIAGALEKVVDLMEIGKLESAAASSSAVESALHETQDGTGSSTEGLVPGPLGS